MKYTQIRRRCTIKAEEMEERKQFLLSRRFQRIIRLTLNVQSEDSRTKVKIRTWTVADQFIRRSVQPKKIGSFHRHRHIDHYHKNIHRKCIVHLNVPLFSIQLWKSSLEILLQAGHRRNRASWKQEMNHVSCSWEGEFETFHSICTEEKRRMHEYGWSDQKFFA